MRIPASAVAAATVATLVAGGLVAWAATAMVVDRAPPPKAFVRGGETYRWDVAHGLTGSISVSGPVRSFSEPPSRPGDKPVRFETANMYLVLTCSGLTSGGVQARFYAPKPPTLQLRLRTDDAVFRVRPRANDLGGADFVEGQGDLPEHYLQSLARTENVSVEYADQITTFPGPGKALAEHFGRYCRQLAQRASHDE